MFSVDAYQWDYRQPDIGTILPALTNTFFILDVAAYLILVVPFETADCRVIGSHCYAGKAEAAEIKSLCEWATAVFRSSLPNFC